MARQRILISACLLGEAVRYNGEQRVFDSDILRRWQTEGRLVPVCPEMAGGLPVPRPPAEIAGAGGGAGVLAGQAQVVDRQGRQVTEAFVAGAQQVLRQARAQHIRLAVLKEGSPSCGSQRIYDGSFSHRPLPGQGVTCALLSMAGLRVFSEETLDEADDLLRACENAVGA